MLKDLPSKYIHHHRVKGLLWAFSLGEGGGVGGGCGLLAGGIWKRRFHSENGSNVSFNTLRRKDLKMQSTAGILDLWFRSKYSSAVQGKLTFLKFLRFVERFRIASSS